MGRYLSTTDLKLTRFALTSKLVDGVTVCGLTKDRVFQIMSMTYSLDMNSLYMHNSTALS